MDESPPRSRQPDSIGQVFLWALLPTLLLVLTPPNGTYAQVATNITATTGGPLDLGTIAATSPTVATTTQITGGTRPGNGTNLFHSFDSFTLGTGDVAHFMNNMQRPTTNIIARVIGKEVSTIDGTLRTNNPLDVTDPMNFGTANLWLVNPSGLLLGPNARVEVGGSVSMSTANYLRFENQPALFDMLSSPASLGQLSVAPVVAFGFTASNPVAITLEGSTLMVGQGKTLSFIGGNAPFLKTLSEAPFEELVPSGVTVTGSSLSAPGGQIQLASIASLPKTLDGKTIPAEVSIADLSVTIVDPFVKQEAVLGHIALTSTTLDVSGQLEFDTDGNPIGGNSGTVFVRGGQLVMDASTILAGTTGAVDGAHTAVDIQVSQDVALKNNSSIITYTFGLGRGGDVQLTADKLTMADVPFGLFTITGGGGVGGDVVLNVREVSLRGASSIQSSNQNFDPGSGRGGNVTIQGLPGAKFGAATSVTLSEGSSLLSQTAAGGDGGKVAITAKFLTMDGEPTTNGETATVKATSNDVGLGGAIDVGVQEAHLNNGATITTLTTGATGSSAPTGGTVTVHGLQGAKSMADVVALSRGSGIVSDTQGTGNSGDVAVYAKTISLTDGAVIQAGTPRPSGAGGAVTLNAASVDISGGSSIASQASEANAGQVTITANELTLDNGSIVTKTTSSSSGGKGGDVVLDVGTVSLSNRATINSSTASAEANAGNAGDVTITFSTTGNTVSLASGSSITSSTAGAGKAGQVKVTTPALSLNDATITTSTSSSGNAGGITANVGTLTLTNAAEIASSSTSTMSNAGDAGSVTLKASGSFTSNASTVSTSAENARGGDILIDAQNLQLSNGTLISASSNAPFSDLGEGNAGNITIHSGSTFVMQNSSVTTEARHASGGEIEITAPDVGGMVRLINSRVSTSVGGVADKSDGGNITIDPQFVILQNSQILAQAVAGAGGRIDIIAGVYLKDPSSQVDASSTLGISGTINIQSPVQNIGGRLTPLSQKFSSAAALLAQRCAARAADGKFSTFVVAGREGLPVEPGGFLASPSWTAELLGSSPAGRYPHTPIAAVTGLFPEYDARPIQLAKFGNACHQ